MRRSVIRNTAVLAAAGLASVGFVGLQGGVTFEPRDLKADFALNPGVNDVSAQAIAALAEVPGVGVECTLGFAGPYPCSNIDLLGFVPLAELGGAAGNDSWGWTDPATGTEIAIMGTGAGTAFVDVTDPVNPAVLGTVPQAGGPATGPGGVLWRDVKVNNDHAFIVAERGGGMQVVDLRPMVGLGADPTRQFPVVATYTGEGFDSAHNIVINEETDRAYLVGGNFSGGLHIVDVADPANPTFLGGHETNGYTHDAQCVVYRGPDADHQGREICFAYNEDTVDIIDVTDPKNTFQVNIVEYDSFEYTHQGWLTEDQSTIVFNDEIDESARSVSATTTYIADVSDLDKPLYDEDVVRYVHPTASVDHNLYIKGDLIYEANYNAGLRILRFTADTLKSGELEEVGFFDVDPFLDVNQYGGAWNVYPYFPSGNLIVSSLDEGLYVLKFNDPALAG